ncbi:MAG: VWA domain-containing protein, partial [Chitinophagales bacterium]|nr:VWA domain-containing protein [Chitinophagales bacterium]
CWLMPSLLCAQEKTKILFLLDASLSMKNEWKGGTKWNTATNALIEIADSISTIGDVEMGLRVFGHLYPEPDKNCRDTRLEVSFDTGNILKLKKKLEEIRPKGITPLVYSIEKCAADFGTSQSRKILIIITDGEDACNRDPCSLQKILEDNGVVLRPFIIGMNLQSNIFQQMNCMGKIINTSNRDEFITALNTTVLESISKTTLQVNLNDAAGKPTETDVNMSFYDSETDKLTYDFYHTINSRGLPDTISLSPVVKYKLIIHTVPPIVKDSIVLKRNTHNVIQVSAPQGFLNFKLQGSTSQVHATDRVKCLLHKPGNQETIQVQRINTKEKYITGTYELEVLTLPRLYLKGLKIDQSKTTDVLIPAPGILTINKSFEAYGGIFMIENGAMKKIYDLHLKERQETIAIQPGKYHLVYRSKNARTIHTSVDKEFEIQSGGSLSLKL